MKCPKCQARTQVVYCKPLTATLNKRLRHCCSCGYRFVTFEEFSHDKTRHTCRSQKPADHQAG